jgi:CRP/FNR family cyclic AMP-dependent transcriptional regulator
MFQVCIKTLGISIPTLQHSYHCSTNPRPIIFIGSSGEGLEIAREIEAGLVHDDVIPRVWTNNVFVPGHGTTEDLEAAIRTADFGVLVCTKDDKILNEVREVDIYAPRDNVILELGMCLGALGRRRTLLVKPRTKDLKIPTDLLGITPIDYTDDDPAHFIAYIGPVCMQIRRIVKNLGPK